MKKMLLIGMLVIGGLSYGRDFTYSEKQEMKIVENVNHQDQSMVSRTRAISRNDQVIEADFQRDLATMDRGHNKN